MIKKIAIIGPESTGKSTLARELAHNYNTCWVKEFSREFFEKRAYSYEIDDLITIAKGQILNEENACKSANELLFCDTDIITIKVWSEIVFNKVPEWINQKVKSHTYPLYLLCNIDVDWEPDKLRNNYHNRQYIYRLFVEELNKHSLNYKVINGLGGIRLNNAISIVEDFLYNG